MIPPKPAYAGEAGEPDDTLHLFRNLMKRLDNTVKFLRMAASQLRRLADRVPEIADELRATAINRL